jgi:hypothetical protein
MENKKFFYDVLDRRSKRLAKLVEMSAPSEMITKEILLVIQAAIGYCPKEIGQVIGWLEERKLKNV